MDMRNLPVERILEVLAESRTIEMAGTAELARRAGAAAAPPVDVQLDILGLDEPLDLLKVDLDEMIGGRRRFITVTEACEITKASPAKMYRRVAKERIGFFDGETIHIDRKLLFRFK